MVDASDVSLTIQELSALTGVPPRRIRFYVCRGLVPPPAGRGPTARYGRIHVERLRAIRELRQKRLGLAEIRAQLARQRTESDAGRSVWYRWDLGEGIVLWVRADLPERQHQQVSTLVEVARRLLQRGEES